MQNVIAAALSLFEKIFPFITAYKYGKLKERDTQRKHGDHVQSEVEAIGNDPLNNRAGVLKWLRKGGQRNG